MYAKRRLARLYQTDEGKRSLVFTAARREFEPDSGTTSDAIIDCPEGMMYVNGSEDSCGEYDYICFKVYGVRYRFAL